MPPDQLHQNGQRVDTVSPHRNRPRERLIAVGPRNLTDIDLLALQVGSGTRSEGADDVGQRLLKRFGSLRTVSQRDPREWMALPGIGQAIACRLGSAFEIGRRVAVEPLGIRPPVRGPEDVARLKAPHLRDLVREEFWVLMLNTASRVIGEHLVSRGGLAASIVEPRDVFGRSILESAASVICVHNHPSGNPEPSLEDLAVTRQLVEAGRILGIPVRDHIIVAGDSFTSFARRGLLD